jgi:hypothetical protein
MNNKKKKKEAWCWWFVPVILAIWEAEIRKTERLKAILGK